MKQAVSLFLITLSACTYTAFAGMYNVFKYAKIRVYKEKNKEKLVSLYLQIQKWLSQLQQ